MIGSIFSINLLRTRYILALFLLIFALLVLYLQILKAPWVDECYSYYGVWHDNFPDFYDSILTGINFSPPLYFFFNFCIQILFPTSIDQLRLQSLVFILLGIILTFLLTRKLFGSTTALVATILITSQSYLLLSQAQEARHYAMFFACGAWVLYTQSFDDNAVKNYIKSTEYGILKVMSKMGISTYQSYNGAQIFDAVGLNSDFVKKYFSGTASLIEGVGLKDVINETKRRHIEGVSSNEKKLF